MTDHNGILLTTDTILIFLATLQHDVQDRNAVLYEVDEE